MPVSSLLSNQRDAVLEKCRDKMVLVSCSRRSTCHVDSGGLSLYDELAEVLRTSLEGDPSGDRHRFMGDPRIAEASRRNAQEVYQLGYTVAQLIHGYGCICQAITEHAEETGIPMTPAEFGRLTLCLEFALAHAVAEFESLRVEEARKAESLRTGFFIHELRNSLSNAMLAHEILQHRGMSGTDEMGCLMASAHQKMVEIMERASDACRHIGLESVQKSRMRLFALLGEIEEAILPAASEKGVSLAIEGDPMLEIEADRHLVVSALSNLVQNAIKVTRPKGHVWIRASTEGSDVIVEIEDRCGGLPEGKAEELFQPYVQRGQDRSGKGLGLAIAHHALELNGAKLSVRDLPGVGCVFAARIPAAAQSNGVTHAAAEPGTAESNHRMPQAPRSSRGTRDASPSRARSGARS